MTIAPDQNSVGHKYQSAMQRWCFFWRRQVSDRVIRIRICGKAAYEENASSVTQIHLSHKVRAFADFKLSGRQKVFTGWILIIPVPCLSIVNGFTENRKWCFL
jgi:hypothetical protein